MSKDLTKVERHRWWAYKRWGRKRGAISQIAREEGVTRQAIHDSIVNIRRKLSEVSQKG